MKKQFPKQLFAAWNDDGDGFYETDESSEGFEDSAVVGVYEFKEVRTKRVTHELIEGAPTPLRKVRE